MALTSLDFDGTDDRIALGTGLTIFDGATEGTVSAWIRRDAAGNVDTIISHFDSSDSNRQFNFQVNASNKAKFIVQNEKNNFNSDHDAVGSTDIDTNEWYHLVGTFSTTNGQKVYVNGVHDGTATTTIEDALDTVTTDAHIGVLEQGGSLSGHADGEIRDVKLFDYELSAEQISSLYSGTYPQTPNHHYKLDEGSGTAVEDHGTATDIDGTITGATYTNGTLDLDGALTIAANGTLSAPRGNLALSANLDNDGTFTNNNGKLLSDGTTYITGDADPVFYDFESTSGQTRIQTDITIQNNLTTSSSASTTYIWTNKTLTMGTATSAATLVHNQSTIWFYAYTGGHLATLQGASSLYPVVVSGSGAFRFGADGGIAQLSNVDWQVALVNDGTSGHIKLTGDAEFDAVTIESGDTLDLNGQRMEMSGTLTNNGTIDYDGMLVTPLVNDDGTANNTATCDLIFTGSGGYDLNGTYRTLLFNGAAEYNPANTGGLSATNCIIAQGSDGVDLDGTAQSCTNLTITTGGTLEPNAATITVAGDFTTSGGLIGKSALDMDGSSTTVEVSDASDFDGLTNATWMGWFKLDDISADRNFMGQSSSFSLQVFENSTNKTRFSLFSNTGAWTDLEGNTTITVDNKWHHIAFVMDGSNNKMYTYIDGKLDAEGAWTETLNGSGADVYLGGYKDGNEKHFAGLYDSASFWTVALTSAQIRAKMFSDFASLDSNTGCVAFWQFDEGTGTSVASSVGSHTGTIANGTWAGAGTFTYGTSTLVMAKSGTQTICILHNTDVNNLTINDGSTTELLTLGTTNGLIDIQGNLVVNEKIKSHADTPHNVVRMRTGDKTITIGSDVKTTALAEIDQLRFDLSGSNTMNVPELTTKKIDIVNGTVVATGDLTLTSELEVESGTTFNANTNTIAAKVVDVNAGTLDLRNSTLNFSVTGSGDQLNLDASSTLLTGNTTITGNSALDKTDAKLPAAGGFEVVGDVKFLKMNTDADLTVIGSVVDCILEDSTANIRQFFHTLDTQQLLDADEAGDDDLRLEKPALDNAVELQTG